MIILNIDDEDGQLSWIDEKDLVADSTYIILTDDVNNLTEQRKMQHFEHYAYADVNGLRTIDSTVKRPLSSLLSQEEAREEHVIGIFKRYKHHKEDPYVTIFSVTAVDEINSFIEAKLVINCRYGQIRSVGRYYEFIEHGLENLSTNYPKPYNYTMCTEDLTSLFVRSGNRYQSEYKKNIRLLLENDLGLTKPAYLMHARFSSSKINNDFTYINLFNTHAIMYETITKEDFVENLTRYKLRINQKLLNRLVFIGLTSGETLLGVEENSGIYYLVKTPNHFKTIPMNKIDREAHVTTVKKVFTLHTERVKEKVTAL